MENVNVIVLFSIVILLSNIIQGVTGFAGTVLAMPFCILLIGLDTSKQILNILGIMASIWIILVSYRNINWKEFSKILFFMIIGLYIGVKLYKVFELNILLKILPLFIVFVGLRGFLILLNKNKINSKKLSNYILNLLLLSSGIIHGMFVSGGPLLVIYATEKVKEKSSFRATLAMVWIVLNLIIAIEGYMGGSFTPKVYKYLIVSIVPFISAMFIGNTLHNKMNKELFMKVSYSLLILSGFIMLL